MRERAAMSAPGAGRRRVFAWSAVFGYSGLAFTLARNVLLVPLYLAYIDLGEYGAWLATGGALVQLLVTDFGLTGVITQRIAARAGARDPVAMRTLISAGLANAVVLAVALSALSSLVGIWLPATQGLATPQVQRVYECFLIAVAANGCGVIGAAALGAVRGAQRPVSAGIIVLAADVVSVAVTLLGLFGGFGLHAIAGGLLARSLVSALAAVVALIPFYRHSSRAWRPTWSDSLAMWRDSGRFFVTSIAMRLQSQANILFVGTILGPHSAAVYGLTVRAHETVHIVMGQLNSAFGPVLAHLAGAGNFERLNTVIRTLVPLIAALALIGTVCVVALNESFVTLWVGAAAYGGIELTALMGVALWITSLAFVGYEALLARGEFSLIARAFALGSLLHVVVLLAGLGIVGVSAAPLAMIASSLCWGGLLWNRVARDSLQATATWRAVLIDSFLMAVAGVVVGSALLALLPPASSWSALAAEAGLAACVVSAVLLAARPGLRRNLRVEIAATLRALRAA